MKTPTVLFIIAGLFLFVIPSSLIAAPAEAERAVNYPHLYCTGYFTPGSDVVGKIQGTPGSQPLGLFIGASLLESPLNHMWGLFFLDSPWFLIGPLGALPADGLMELPTTLPSTAGPYDLYFQALIGDELTNLYVMEVRDSSPSGMVRIPGGEFEMGDHHSGMAEALPVHAVYVDSFFMDVFEVTNRQYCDFLNAIYSQGEIELIVGQVFRKGEDQPYCNTTEHTNISRITWDGSTFGIVEGKEDHPMLEVSWWGAAAYANWRSTQAGRTPCYDLDTGECAFGAGGYRLPTEAEWERAARGGEHSPYHEYPWGNYIDGSTSNYWISGDPMEGSMPDWPWTTPVGYYDGYQIPAGHDMANGYGLYDMAGNVYEWCNDKWHPEYYQYCVDRNIYENPRGPANGTTHVIRGGSWFCFGYTHQVNCAYRHEHGYPGFRENDIGFRLVLE